MHDECMKSSPEVNICEYHICDDPFTNSEMLFGLGISRTWDTGKP